MHPFCPSKTSCKQVQCGRSLGSFHTSLQFVAHATQLRQVGVSFGSDRFGHMFAPGQWRCWDYRFHKFTWLALLFIALLKPITSFHTYHHIEINHTPVVYGETFKILRVPCVVWRKYVDHCFPMSHWISCSYSAKPRERRNQDSHWNGGQCICLPSDLMFSLPGNADKEAHQFNWSNKAQFSSIFYIIDDIFAKISGTIMFKFQPNWDYTQRYTSSKSFNLYIAHMLIMKDKLIQYTIYLQLNFLHRLSTDIRIRGNIVNHKTATPPKKMLWYLGKWTI